MTWWRRVLERVAYGRYARRTWTEDEGPAEEVLPEATAIPPGTHVQLSAGGVWTSGGVPLTDDLIERLNAEAERGYDVDRLRRRD